MVKTIYLALFAVLIGVGVTSAYAINITLDGNVFITQILNMMGNRIADVGSPTEDTDAATKGYVDSSPDADTLANLECTTDQVARWTGIEWTCNNIVLQEVETRKVVVDPLHSIGYTSIAIGNDGFPVISYLDDTLDELKVAKCVNAECSGTSTITAVDSTDIVGSYTSIAIGDDGFPVISYYDDTNGNLKVAKCVNDSCTGTSTITAVDTTGDVGRYTSIAIGNEGLPVISYYDFTNGGLKVAKCVNVSCTGTSTITTLDVTFGDGVGLYTSIAIDNEGLPVVSYLDFQNRNLKVAKCVNDSCTGTSTITAVDTVGLVGSYASIAIGDDGLPVISYFDNTKNHLKVAKCVNDSCTGTSTITAVDTTAPAQYTSIAIGNDGLPRISYYDAGKQNLKLAKCNNTDCTEDSTISTVDTGGGLWTSIAIGTDGLPVVSYRGSDDLKVFKKGTFLIGFE